MTELILHHYDLSPFSEKIRIALGYKKLDWLSVEISIWPPRPDLAPMMAGYRRAPVLQIGADVYCDTLLILRELDRRHPSPTLYPGGQLGLVGVLSLWADEKMFMSGATLTTSIIGDGVPEAFLKDRIGFMKHDFSKAASLRELPLNTQRMHAAMNWLADMLRDGRAFLLGDALSAADLSAYHPLWFIAKNGGEEAQAMLPYAPLRAWMDRIGAIGHGRRTALVAEEALAIARRATPAAVGGVAANDPCGLNSGDAVLVRTEEAGEPIRGTLVAANADAFVIRNENERAGVVHVHFPRVGYNLLAA